MYREFPDRGAAAFMRALRLLLTEYLGISQHGWYA